METKVVMPRLGSEMTEGIIVEWLKKEGDSVKKGEALCIVDTQKANVEVESEFSGILKKILVNDKELAIPVGKDIAIMEIQG